MIFTLDGGIFLRIVLTCTQSILTMCVYVFMCFVFFSFFFPGAFIIFQITEGYKSIKM